MSFMRNIISLILFGFAAMLQPRSHAASQEFYVPAFGGGNSPTPGPFGGLEPIRWQQVYDASAFSAITLGGGMITQIGFRGADLPGNNGTEIITNLQIDLSTTSRGSDGLSSVFSANVGPDDKVVLGPKLFPYGATRSGYSFITLDQPFFYNPVAGNLLLDVRNYGELVNFSTAFALDAELQLGDSVSSVASLPNDVNSSSGTASTLGLFTEFTVTPVPEPSTLALGGFGTVALLVGVYIQTKTKKRKGKATWH